jgi:hypothetical protein
MPRKLISPDELPKYGFPSYSNRHRKRLEDKGVLPRRVPITSQRYGYAEDELVATAEAFIAKRDAAKTQNAATDATGQQTEIANAKPEVHRRRDQPIVEECATA